MSQSPDAHGLDCPGEQVMVVVAPSGHVARFAPWGLCRAASCLEAPSRGSPTFGRIRELLKTATVDRGARLGRSSRQEPTSRAPED